MQESQKTWVRSLSQEGPLEEEMATHSSILAGKIPWTDEPGRLQSVRLQRSDMTEYTYFITSPSLFLGGPLWPLHSHASGSPLLPHHAPPTHPAPRVSDLQLPGPLSLSAPVPFLFLFTHSVLFVWACVCFFRKTVDSFESKNLFMPAPVA